MSAKPFMVPVTFYWRTKPEHVAAVLGRAGTAMDEEGYPVKAVDILPSKSTMSVTPAASGLGVNVQVRAEGVTVKIKTEMDLARLRELAAGHVSERDLAAEARRWLGQAGAPDRVSFHGALDDYFFDRVAMRQVSEPEGDE